jgi:hypothetical protein
MTLSNGTPLYAADVKSDGTAAWTTIMAQLVEDGEGVVIVYETPRL